MSGEQQRFLRSQRLLQAVEFEAVFAHRCSWRTPCFQILARPNEAGAARLGMVVSKRLFSRAVDRNLVRRKLREVFRRTAVRLPALDLVIRPLGLPESMSEIKPDSAEAQAQLSKDAAKKPQKNSKKPTVRKTLNVHNAAWLEELQNGLIKAAEKCHV